MGSGGLDTKATGKILTPPYCVNIIQLCLDGMGTRTSEAEIVIIYETGFLPLMPKNNYKSWSKGFKKGNLPNANYLYGNQDDGDKIPSDIMAIGKIMTLPP